MTNTANTALDILSIWYNKQTTVWWSCLVKFPSAPPHHNGNKFLFPVKALCQTLMHSSNSRLKVCYNERIKQAARGRAYKTMSAQEIYQTW